MATLIPRPFFGGAIQASLPEHFKDIASVRQVPDNQECWHDIDREVLFVLECLEHDPSLDANTAAQNSWEELCATNESTQRDFESFSYPTDPRAVYGLPNTSTVGCGVGHQRVKMGRAHDVYGNSGQQEERFVRVELCLIRLPSVQTDLLVTLSTPLHPNAEGDENQVPDATFRSILSSLEIRDWNLYG